MPLLKNYFVTKNESEKENAIPLPLTKCEMDEFVNSDKIKEISFLAYDDEQIPSVPHFFGIYQRIWKSIFLKFFISKGNLKI